MQKITLRFSEFSDRQIGLLVAQLVSSSVELVVLLADSAQIGISEQTGVGVYTSGRGALDLFSDPWQKPTANCKADRANKLTAANITCTVSSSQHSLNTGHSVQQQMTNKR